MRLRAARACTVNPDAHLSTRACSKARAESRPTNPLLQRNPMQSNFDLSKLAQALKNVGDCGAALIQDCTARAKDGAVSGANIEDLKSAIFDTWTLIAPRAEAADTDPALAEQERKLKTSAPSQETAKDSRFIDGRTHGPTSPFSGCGDIELGRGIDAPSVSDIFNTQGQASSVDDHDVAAVFGGDRLAEG